MQQYAQFLSSDHIYIYARVVLVQNNRLNVQSESDNVTSIEACVGLDFDQHGVG